MINRIASLIYRDKTIKSIEKKIKLLLINNNYNAITFMNIRVITSILVPGQITLDDAGVRPVIEINKSYIKNR